MTHALKLRNSAIAATIGIARQSLAMSVSDFATAIGETVDFVNAIESGEGELNDLSIEACAKALDISVIELYGLADADELIVVKKDESQTGKHGEWLDKAV